MFILNTFAQVTLPEQFIHNYTSRHLFTKKDKLLLAVSGGADSVALCMLCSLAGLDFAIAHCNFQLRGADAKRDEVFVKNLAAQLGVPFYTVSFETQRYAAEQKVSTQVAARELRYKWFEEVASANGYHYIATAHHADDNIETILMSFFRGTGIKGLTGIREKKGRIVRPLLFARRKELEQFISDHQIAFVQDDSNLSDDYTRNYFRNKIVPAISAVFPEVQQNLLDNIPRMKGAALLYDEAVAAKRKKLIQEKGNEFWIPVLLLQQQKTPLTLLYELTKDFGFTPAQLTDMQQLLQSESGKYILSATHRILRNRSHLIISPLADARHTTVIIEEPGSFSYANGTLTVKASQMLSLPVTADKHIAMLDAKYIQYPLLLRRWKTGDYFYPLGMQKKKKVARFLIDQKLSLTEKEKVWVLEMDKKIIWVIGYRIDDRFKVTEKTKSVLQVKVKF